MPGFEEFLDGLNDKIADIWALLKYKGKITINPDGPNGPDITEGYASIARTVVRGRNVQNFNTPFSDAELYLRTGIGYENRNPNQSLDDIIGSPTIGI